MVESIDKLQNNLIGKTLNFLELDGIMEESVNSPSEFEWLSENKEQGYKEVLKEKNIFYQICNTDNHFKIHFATVHGVGADEALSATFIEVTDITIA